MYCKNCGKKLPDEAQFCSNCGQETGFLAGDPNSRQANAPTYWSPQRYPAAGAAQALGIIGLIFLIAGIFSYLFLFSGLIFFLTIAIITLIFGVLAVIFSAVYKEKHYELLQGQANTGLVLGIICVVMSIIIIYVVMSNIY